MNDATSPPAPPPPVPQRRATDAAPARFGRRRALLMLVGVGLALAVAYAVLESKREANLQREFAGQQARAAAEATERAQAAARQADEAQRKLAELEQAAASAAAAEAPVPLAALELADVRLAATGSARWVALRRALARDIERLRTLPAVDTTGIALKIDQLIAGVDVWPMANTPAPPPKASPRTVAKKAEPAPEAPPPPPPGAWQRLRAWIAAEFGELVRIHEVAAPEALLLNAEQEKLIRQQLKLRLLGARVALLARTDRLFRSDIENAQTLLALYFEPRQPAVANAAATLRQLNATALAFELPTLADSQAAVRIARKVR